MRGFGPAKTCVRATNALVESNVVNQCHRLIILYKYYMSRHHNASNIYLIIHVHQATFYFSKERLIDYTILYDRLHLQYQLHI